MARHLNQFKDEKFLPHCSKHRMQWPKQWWGRCWRPKFPHTKRWYRFDARTEPLIQTFVLGWRGLLTPVSSKVTVPFVAPHFSIWGSIDKPIESMMTNPKSPKAMKQAKLKSANGSLSADRHTAVDRWLCWGGQNSVLLLYFEDWGVRCNHSRRMRNALTIRIGC